MIARTTELRRIFDRFVPAMIAAGVLLGIAAPIVSGQPRDDELPRDSASDYAAPPVKLAPLTRRELVRPELSLAEPTSPQLAERIERLIASLAKLERPVGRLRAWPGLGEFSPLPNLAHASVAQRIGRPIVSQDAIPELVAIGPLALPALLAALDDQTPTKITFEHRPNDFGETVGGMYHAGEMSLNPLNPREAKLHAQGKSMFPAFSERGARAKSKPVATYTLKVGDVCFCVLGEIVGRAYHAQRDQPTGLVVLNCPTATPELLANVRETWTSDDARRMLYESLLDDLAVQGDAERRASGERTFAVTAEQRLRYYFPSEAEKLRTEDER